MFGIYIHLDYLLLLGEIIILELKMALLVGHLFYIKLYGGKTA